MLARSFWRSSRARVAEIISGVFGLILQPGNSPYNATGAVGLDISQIRVHPFAQAALGIGLIVGSRQSCR
jgi:hypothetical protein